MLRRIVLVGSGALALSAVIMVPGIAAAKPLTGTVACTLSGTATITPGLPLQNDPPVAATKTYTSTTTFTGTLTGCTGDQQNINTKKGFGPIDHGTTTAVGKTKYKKGMNLPGTPLSTPVYSGLKTVYFGSSTSLKASATRVYRGRGVTLSGAVLPKHAGAKVTIQYYSGGWRNWRTVTIGSGGTFATTWTSVRGTWSFRAVFGGDATHTGSTSATVKVQVL